MNEAKNSLGKVMSNDSVITVRKGSALGKWVLENDTASLPYTKPRLHKFIHCKKRHAL
jgi:hypothetical protein